MSNFRSSRTDRSRKEIRNGRLRAPGNPITIVLLATIFACQSEPPDDRPTHLVARGTIERIVIATGTVEPAIEVEIRPRIPGIIEKIHVKEGDLVQVGQPLIEIERELLASQVRESEANLEAAGIELHFSKIALDRNEELHQTGAASDQSHDDASARYRRARAERARAQAVVDTLTTQHGYATVKSSMVGRVLEVHVEEGGAVSPVSSVTGGTLLFSLAGDKTLHLEGLVDENEIARVELGQRARIRTEAYGDRIFEGLVREIAPMGKRIQNVTYFEVKVEITDADAQILRPRMSGDAEIITAIVEDTIIVPETTLRYRGSDVLVDLVDTGQADSNSEIETPGDSSSAERASRVVEVGIIDGDRVQILGGLDAGERIRLQ